MSQSSDEQLIAEYVRGDFEALTALFERYLKPIYQFVYRYVHNVPDAEDITQEVFIKVWKHSRKFDQKKRFKTWIFAIAKNTALDFLKKSRSASGGKKIVPFSELEHAEGEGIGEGSMLDTLADPAPLPPEVLARADITQVLKEAVDQLPFDARTVLFLYYYDHFNFREIAETLGQSIDTVKSRHRRALFRLKELLIKQVGEIL